MGPSLNFSTVMRVDMRIWTGPALFKLIVYGLDVAHPVLAPEPLEPEPGLFCKSW